MSDTASEGKACAYCKLSEPAPTWKVGPSTNLLVIHRECWKCQEPSCDTKLDLLTYWWSQSTGQGFCVQHRPSEIPVQLGGGNVGPLRVVFRSLRGSTAIAGNPETDGLLKDLAQAQEEVAAGKSEAAKVRERLTASAGTSSATATSSSSSSSTTVASTSSHSKEMGLSASTPVIRSLNLVPGDRTDSVHARNAETGSRMERQLVSSGASLRLTENAHETGVSLWSLPAGQSLRSLVATVGPVAGHPFHLLFEGPHSELQVWCSNVEQMDGWVAWARKHHPKATVTRIDGGSSSSSPGSQTARPKYAFTRRFVRQKSTIGSPDSSTTEEASPSKSPVTAAKTMRVSADVASSSSEDLSSSHLAFSPERKGPGGFSKWAKNLLSKADPGSKRGSAVVKQVDVFSASLEEIMEEQVQVFPNMRVPMLMNFLTEEVLRCGGAKTEGIFRISASHAELADLVATIKKAKGFDYKLPPFKDAHVPAALMKQWLRDLPVPLFRDYNGCLDVTKLPNNSPEEVDGYVKMVEALSDVHRDVVLFLIDFLGRIGDPANVSATKMPLANLALVFVPSFLRCPSSDITQMLMNQPAEQKFVQTLVEYGAAGKLVRAVAAAEDTSVVGNGRSSSSSISINSSVISSEDQQKESK